MASVFTKIIRGEIPSYKVAEDENYIAILDAFPVVKGHTLVIPKKEVDKIYELDEQTYTGLMLFARRVARAIERAIPCIRVGVSVVGLDVHHVHVHLLPLNGPSDMDLNREKLSLTPEQMQQVADEIAAQLDKSDDLVDGVVPLLLEGVVDGGQDGLDLFVPVLIEVEFARKIDLHVGNTSRLVRFGHKHTKYCMCGPSRMLLLYSKCVQV